MEISGTGRELTALHQKLLTPVEDASDLAEQLHAMANDIVQKNEKINFEPEKVEKGMAKLVLTVMELLYQLMERQALKRIDGGSLTDEEIERLGLAFMNIDAQMDKMVDIFGLERDDLNLDLGPLGNLM